MIWDQKLIPLFEKLIILHRIKGSIVCQFNFYDILIMCALCKVQLYDSLCSIYRHFFVICAKIDSYIFFRSESPRSGRKN